MKKIAIVIIAVVVIGAAAALYFFVLADPSEKPEIRVEYSPGEFFTTNVANGSHRLLKAGVILVVNENGLEEMLAAQNARIRHTIIFILRGLTEEEIRKQNQDELCERIITELNEMLGIDNFVEVLFNDFVMA